jgi:predicted PurR-regulated permease PerM
MTSPGDHPSAQSHPAPRPPADWRLLRLWQIQPIRDALVILALFGLLYLGKALSLVTVPVLLALALAYLFEPLVRRITARGRISRPGAAIGIILLALLLVVVPLVIGLGFATLQGASYAQRVGINVQQLINTVNNPADQGTRGTLPASWQRIADKIIDLQARARRAEAALAAAREGAARQGPPVDSDNPAAEPKAPNEILTEAESRDLQLAQAVRFSLNWLRDNAQTISTRLLSTGADALQAALGIVVSLAVLLFGGFLTAFFFYFFCTGYGRVLAFWEGLIPERRKGRVIDLLQQMDKVISGFIRGRLIICFILMGYYTLAYWAIGLHAWLLLGPIIGLLTLIPYASGISIPIAILLMWLEPPDRAWQSTWWWMTFSPMAVQLFQQVIDDYVLSPRIQGEATGMDVPTILFASIAGGVLGGFYGVLLAIPVGACIKILLHEIVMPQVKAWAEGKARDPLPIS